MASQKSANYLNDIKKNRSIKIIYGIKWKYEGPFQVTDTQIIANGHGV
jgi:hypothetical protein